MNKKSGFSIVFYIIGTIILITMSVFIVINFKNDARIFNNSPKEATESTAYLNSDADRGTILLCQIYA